MESGKGKVRKRERPLEGRRIINQFIFLTHKSIKPRVEIVRPELNEHDAFKGSRCDMQKYSVRNTGNPSPDRTIDPTNARTKLGRERANHPPTSTTHHGHALSQRD